MTAETKWTELVARLKSGRSSPVLMPASILTLLDLARMNRVSDGRVVFSDFEPAFRKLLATVIPNSTAKAWLPFYHLSGRVGLWTLHGHEDLPDGWKPTGRSGLVKHVEYAQIAPDLVGSLNEPSEIDAIESAILEMLEDDAKSQSTALAKLRRGATSPR